MMKRVQRFDSARVKARFDDNGFMIDNPIVARIGLQVYRKPDGTERREFRPASEVFKPESLATYQGKPVTLGHVMVNSKNARDVVVGACSGPATRNGIGVEVPLIVYDDESINKAKKKLAAEISVGYSSVDIEEGGWGCNETGEYILDSQKQDQDYIPASWVRFDAVQTEIEVNHIALVFRGRAGVAKLNLDSEQEFPYDAIEHFKTDNGELPMKTIKIDSAEFEVAPEVAAHIEKLDADKATAEAATATATAQRDQLQVKVDGIPEVVKTEVEKAVAKAKADAEQHADLVAFATEIGVKHDGLDDKAIKLACIKELSGVDASSKEDAYIDSAFDFARQSDKMAANRIAVAGKPGKSKKDSADIEIPDPQARFRK